MPWRGWRQARFRERRAEHVREMRSLADQRALWSETALRRTTLPPGTDVRGRVLFSVSEAARYVVFQLPVGAAQPRFFYWQFRIDP